MLGPFLLAELGCTSSEFIYLLPRERERWRKGWRRCRGKKNSNCEKNTNENCLFFFVCNSYYFRLISFYSNTRTPRVDRTNDSRSSCRTVRAVRTEYSNVSKSICSNGSFMLVRNFQLSFNSASLVYETRVAFV